MKSVFWSTLCSFIFFWDLKKKKHIVFGGRCTRVKHPVDCIPKNKITIFPFTQTTLTFVMQNQIGEIFGRVLPRYTCLPAVHVAESYQTSCLFFGPHLYLFHPIFKSFYYFFPQNTVLVFTLLTFMPNILILHLTFIHNIFISLLSLMFFFKEKIQEIKVISSKSELYLKSHHMYDLNETQVNFEKKKRDTLFELKRHV